MSLNMWNTKPQSVSCFEKSHSLLGTITTNKMSSFVGERANCWGLSMESESTSKEEVISQAQISLDFDCGKTNLQLGITENPQREELLRKCFNYGCE